MIPAGNWPARSYPEIDIVNVIQNKLKATFTQTKARKKARNRYSRKPHLYKNITIYPSVHATFTKFFLTERAFKVGV